MGLHINLPFLKHNKINLDDNDTASTTEPSKYKTAMDAFLAAFSTEKYMNDPMRTTNHPDVVGYYYDPMSIGGGKGLAPGYHVVSAGYDVTNTGA